MTKFKSLVFRSLPNAAHYNFCAQVNQKLALVPSTVASVLGQLPSQFNAWFVKETALMEWVRRSELTAQIAEADTRMDHALVGLNAQVHAATYSVDPVIAQAANRLEMMLEGYGHVYKKPYEEQDGDVRAILMQITTGGHYVGDINTLGLTAWVTELQAAFTLFNQLLSQRDTWSQGKPAEGFPAVRRGIEDIYHQITRKIESGSEISVSASDFNAFINGLNPEIERLNNEFHRIRHDIANAQPEPIPQQAYTEQPVTPTPAVYYVTSGGTVKLELGKDYNLTYRNNTEVGNAECTVHGKGAYRGSKTVTFIIARV
jgi:hypothetical protein